MQIVSNYKKVKSYLDTLKLQYLFNHRANYEIQQKSIDNNNYDVLNFKILRFQI